MKQRKLNQWGGEHTEVNAENTELAKNPAPAPSPAPEAETNADKYKANYTGMEVAQGSSQTIAAPKVTNKTDGSATSNVSATYSAVENETPTWAKVNEDGSIDLTPATDTEVGMYNIPVQVTYTADNSQQKIYAPAYVTDGNSHAKFGTKGAIVTVSDPVVIHETTDASMSTNEIDKQLTQSVKEFDIYDKADDGQLTDPTKFIREEASGNYKASDQVLSPTISWASWLTPINTIRLADGGYSFTQMVEIHFNNSTVLKDKGSDFDGNSYVIRFNQSVNMVGVVPNPHAHRIDTSNGRTPTSEELGTVVNQGLSGLGQLPADISVDHFELQPGKSINTVINPSDYLQTIPLRIVYKDKNASGHPTYLDVNIRLEDTGDVYWPEYNAKTIKRGQTGSVDIQWTKHTPDLSQTTFSLNSSAPDWVSIDSSNGTLTYKPSSDVPVDAYRIPVHLTYFDGNIETVTAIVGVIDDHSNINFDDNGSYIYKNEVVDYHKTSDSQNHVDINKSGLSEIEYIDVNGHSTSWKLSEDGTKYVSSDGGQTFDANAINYEWAIGDKPSTDVSAFEGNTETLLYRVNGRTNAAEQNNGDPKWKIKATFSDTAPEVLKGQKITLPVYFNFYGAKAGEKQTYQKGEDISHLTQEKFRELVDTTDLGQNGWNGVNTNPSSIQSFAYVPGTDSSKTFTMTWAPNGMPSTAEVKNDVDGTVRISFNDGSYLDVPIKINVKDGSDHDSGNTPKQGTVVINYVDQATGVVINTITLPGEEGSTLDPYSTIKNNVPSGFKIQDGFQIPTSATISSTIDIPIVKDGIPGKDPDDGGNPQDPGNKDDQPTDNNDQHHESENQGQQPESHKDYQKSSHERTFNKQHAANASNDQEAAKQTANELPQTSANDSLGILGVALTGLASFLGLAGERKRKN